MGEWQGDGALHGYSQRAGREAVLLVRGECGERD
jgi:hypothetical protein